VSKRKQLITANKFILSRVILLVLTGRIQTIPVAGNVSETLMIYHVVVRFPISEISINFPAAVQGTLSYSFPSYQPDVISGKFPFNSPQDIAV